jgi:hypothetical protein
MVVLVVVVVVVVEVVMVNYNHYRVSGRRWQHRWLRQLSTGNDKCKKEFLSENPKVFPTLRQKDDTKFYLNKYSVKVLTGLMWLRIRSSNGKLL